MRVYILTLFKSLFFLLLPLPNNILELFFTYLLLILPNRLLLHCLFHHALFIPMPLLVHCNECIVCLRVASRLRCHIFNEVTIQVLEVRQKAEVG